MRMIDYYAHHNHLTSWHPLEKAAFAFSHLFLVLLVKSVAAAGFVFFVMSLATVLAAGVPWRRYLFLLSLPLVFLLVGMLPLIVTVAPAESYTAALIESRAVLGWSAAVSLSGLEQAAILSSSAYAAVSCMYFFILTTPFQGMALALNALRVPQVFIDLTAVTYRFIFVLVMKAEETYKAQKSRAGYSSWRSSLCSLSSLTANLFVQTMREAREVQMAADARLGGEEGTKGGAAAEYALRPRAWGIALFLLSLSAGIGVFF